MFCLAITNSPAACPGNSRPLIYSPGFGAGGRHSKTRMNKDVYAGFRFQPAKQPSFFADKVLTSEGKFREVADGGWFGGRGMGGVRSPPGVSPHCYRGVLRCFLEGGVLTRSDGSDHSCRVCAVPRLIGPTRM
jgi:hypothetical protein